MTGVDRNDIEYDFWREHPNATDRDLREVCARWISYQRRRPHDNDDDLDPDWWAVMAVMDVDPGNHGPELAWRLIRCLCELTEPDDEAIVGMIGASPLEEFIGRHGDYAMGLIEPAAEGDAVLTAALTEVWAFGAPARPRLERYLSSRGLEPGGGFRYPMPLHKPR